VFAANLAEMAAMHGYFAVPSDDTTGSVQKIAEPESFCTYALV
jgi:hypothetical protein